MTDSTTESPTQPPTSLSPSRPNAFPSSQAHAEQASQDSSTHLDSDLHSLDALSPFSDQAMPYENDGVDQTHAEGGEPHKVDTTGNDAGHDFHNKRQGGRHHPNLDGNYSEEEEKNSTTKSDGDSHSSYNDVEDLTSLDWNELYQRFESEMQKKRDEEEQLHKRYQQLMEMYEIWASSGPAREESRARKRLCTRIAYVTHSEDMLQEKRSHRDKVVNAFESAMKLLD